MNTAGLMLLKFICSLTNDPLGIMHVYYRYALIFMAGVLISGSLLPAPAAARGVHPDTTDTLQWQRPRFAERSADRARMVEEALSNQIQDKRVLQAMRRVPRHLFVPEAMQPYAYQNRPLPIGHGQTISQPYIVALMSQMLELEAGERVLEIGTGSGYQAAVLSELTPHVFTIEIVEALGQQARRRFDTLGYSTIQTRIGDGYQGWPEHAPFDAIILTAAPPSIPQPLLRQLAPGGVLVAPLGRAGQVQMLTKVVKNADGQIERTQQIPVRFVPMTGDAQKQDK